MKRIIIAILALVLVTSVYAQDDYDNIVYTPNFDIKYTLVGDTISVFEEAEIEMVVVNNMESSQRFRIKEFSDSWELRTDPISVMLSGMIVDAGRQSEPFKVYLNPSEDLKIGQYEIVLNVKFEPEEKYSTLPVTVYIGRPDYEALQYVPSIAVDASVADEVDPREEYVIELELDNLNRFNISDLVISITSEDDLFVGEEHTSLLPLEKNKKVEIRKTLDPMLEPQTEEITLTFKVGERIVKTLHRTVNIKDYTTSLTLNKDVDKRFLKTVQSLVYTNEGNAPREETVMVETSFWRNLVTSTKPRAKTITDSDGKRYLAWDMALEPGASSDVIVVATSYRLLTFLILAALAYLGYWYITKSPIVVKKTAESVHSKGGGITDLKVKLTVKNPTRNTIRHVHIVDKVPSLADVVREFEVGTLKPDKILKHEREGTTLLKWELESLEPFEERILVYKIKPQLSIVGGFTLPPLIVRYRKKHQEIIVRSPKLVVKG